MSKVISEEAYYSTDIIMNDLYDCIVKEVQNAFCSIVDNDRKLKAIKQLIYDEVWSHYMVDFRNMSSIKDYVSKGKSAKKQNPKIIVNNLHSIYRSLQGRIFSIAEACTDSGNLASFKDVLFRCIWRRYDNILERLNK